MCRLVEPGRGERAAGEALARLERVQVVPPDAAGDRVPARVDEPQGACRVGEESAVVRGAVRVELRDAPPSLVVVPGAPRLSGRRAAVARHRSQVRVPVALGSYAEAACSGDVGPGGIGDRDRVVGAEQVDDPPQRRPPAVPRGGQVLVVPAAPWVPPGASVCDARACGGQVHGGRRSRERSRRVVRSRRPVHRGRAAARDRPRRRQRRARPACLTQASRRRSAIMFWRSDGRRDGRAGGGRPRCGAPARPRRLPRRRRRRPAGDRRFARSSARSRH